MNLQELTYSTCRRFLADFLSANPHTSLPCKKWDGWLRSRNLKNIAGCSDSVDIQSLTTEDLKCTLQVEAFFKKNSCFTSDGAKQAAIDAFLLGEERCRATNERLQTWETSLHADHIKTMIHVIREALGSIRPFAVSIPDRLRLTSGATVYKSRELSKPHLRIGRRVHGSPLTCKLLRHLFTEAGLPMRTKVTTHNRVICVDKNWKTMRTIACESEGNLLFQLAFDDYAKSCLLRYFGIDLRDQSRNQLAAYAASFRGERATVDLKQASDSTALEAVHVLFDVEWARFLIGTSARRYLLEGAYGDYHKYASMGNGTTFPVETLIFAAACKAVGQTDIIVYGDDIVIDSDKTAILISLLSYLGFETNSDKTHVDGTYRESCGVHFKDGVDVQPRYLDFSCKTDQQQSMLVNDLVHIGLPGGAVWETARNLARRSIRGTESLLVVPYNPDKTNGVAVCASTAYEKGLIRYGKVFIPQLKRKVPNGIPSYSAYLTKSETETCYDLRGYLLWLFRARVNNHGESVAERKFAQQRAVVGVWAENRNCLRDLTRQVWKAWPQVFEQRIASCYTSPSHKYTVTMIPYIGASETPAHIYMWSDFLFA